MKAFEESSDSLPSLIFGPPLGPSPPLPPGDFQQRFSFVEEGGGFYQAQETDYDGAQISLSVWVPPLIIAQAFYLSGLSPPSPPVYWSQVPSTPLQQVWAGRGEQASLFLVNTLTLRATKVEYLLPGLPAQVLDFVGRLWKVPSPLSPFQSLLDGLKERVSLRVSQEGHKAKLALVKEVLKEWGGIKLGEKEFLKRTQGSKDVRINFLSKEELQTLFIEVEKNDKESLRGRTLTLRESLREEFQALVETYLRPKNPQNLSPAQIKTHLSQRQSFGLFKERHRANKVLKEAAKYHEIDKIFKQTYQDYISSPAQLQLSSIDRFLSVLQTKLPVSLQDRGFSEGRDLDTGRKLTQQEVLSIAAEEDWWKDASFLKDADKQKVFSEVYWDS